MRVGVIGSGITGLTTAYSLSKKGHRVIVLEKNSFAGGLASGIKAAVDDYPQTWTWDLDSFYHHFFVSDREVLALIQELDLQKKLFFKPTKTSLFTKGKIFRFDTPGSLIRFPLLNLKQKMRVGLVLLWLRYLSSWKNLEKQTVSKHLPKLMGEKGYQTLWQPLFRKKFGKNYRQINLAWFWARIKKRSQKLGYLKGGFQVLIDKLMEAIKEKGGTIRLIAEVTSINKGRNWTIETTDGEQIDADVVVVTLPPLGFLKIAPQLPAWYKKNLQRIKYLGALSLILALKHPFLDEGTYWLNINQENIPFLALVEHTNFIDRKKFAQDAIVYVGNYLEPEDPLFRSSKEAIMRKFLPHFQKINPSFDKNWVKKTWLFKASCAQPIFGIDHSENIPLMRTPLKNLFYASMAQVYPWDRGTNYAVEMGRRVAQEISNI